ncbi:hypothetical protein J2S10_003133 [Neobacillus ginsengisoli]|uniref:Uncharacterized protein n=1 Tax=Neobacillus ginsengisoli TaxID=904295 RepID=A0ABT9XXG4_9BACI|nr:hypothetical protein [Neobacillus ginsengisoli]
MKKSDMKKLAQEVLNMQTTSQVIEAVNDTTK